MVILGCTSHTYPTLILLAEEGTRHSTSRPYPIHIGLEMENVECTSHRRISSVEVTVLASSRL